VRELTSQAKGLVDSYGPAGAFMSFCPGSAVTREGDPLHVYPDALRRMEVMSEVLAEGRTKDGAEKRRLLPILP
jgi:hypothetical protein